MCEGRSFEQVDQMTLFDLSMINKYRRDNPHTEDLVALIARYLGIYKPPESQEEVQVSSLPDPREAIKQAFAGMKFDPAIGVSDVL